MILTLHGYAQYQRDEILVVQDGIPIPFEWVGHDTIEVDDVFERAAIQIRPIPNQMRKVLNARET